MFRPIGNQARRAALPLGGLVLAAFLAACSSSGGGVPSAAATPVASPGATASAAVVASTAASSATTRVSANSASEPEIAAALQAAGVPNATRWAREVTEYRPYPTDDPTLQKLQHNLAKYNPDPATLAGILSALTP